MSGSTIGRAPSAALLPGAQQVAVRAASFGILAVLLSLAACALWGAAATYRADTAVKRASEASNAIEIVRKGAGAEHLLRQTAGALPGTAARAQHHDDAEAMRVALSQAHMFTDAADRRMVEQLQQRFRDYLDSVGTTWGDGPEPLPDGVRLPSRGDPAQATETLADIQASANLLSDRFRIEALNLQQLLVAIQMRVLIAGPVLFGFGLLLVGAIWRAQRAEERRGTAQLVQTAYDSGRDERRFRGIVDYAPDLVLICAGPGSVAYSNAAALAHWSYDEEQLVGQSVLMLAHPDDRPALRAWWEQLTPAGIGTLPPDSLELRLQDGRGQWRDAEVVGTNLLDEPTVKGVVLTVRDIARRRHAEQARTGQALFDPLTRLPNGPLLRDRLAQALVRCGRGGDPVGVLAIAVDELAQADDRYGPGGTEALALEAATRLKACVRPQDTVGRLDDVTFVVVGEVTDPAALAERIVTQLSRPIRVGTMDAPQSVRIGVAIGGARAGSADDLMRDAGLALQRVGPGALRYALFDSGSRSAMLDRVELQGDLQGAVEALRRGGETEFRVFYQPIVDLASGRFCGFEALIRWQHPGKGLVSPAEFIPLAETTGLIVPLGQWVLEQACHQLAAWQDRYQADPPLALSVNLSPLQFQQSRLVADVRRAVRSAGLVAGCLRLEITEGTIMRDPDLAVRSLWALKELGIQLAIDDYGSGYSALPYLKQLPLGMLKIDGALVADIGRDGEDASTVRAIVSLALSLGWSVTAEGIETSAQAALLRDLGCQFGQGYHFGHPLDRDAAQALLANGRSFGERGAPLEIAKAPA